MKSIIVTVAMVASSFAMADGFVCKATQGDLNLQVYNQVQPDLGTRNAAVMVVSDPAVQHGRKTIAVFTAENRTLANSGSLYIGKVDLRFTETGRKGENIAGTKLGQLKKLVLDADFSYASPVEDGEEVEALLTLVKRNGDSIERDMICARYLKN